MRFQTAKLIRKYLYSALCTMRLAIYVSPSGMVETPRLAGEGSLVKEVQNGKNILFFF